ncbi:hypothetical protein DRN84_01530 [Candidatus Geothermarchaeota archaeon]|nr:MAG: hypothetical protein DRN87_02165 [Candidatus Geothermarchaeota archaeon]RLG62587.1 MAG: hypothetical protein DRN84_01530 [Candidatus Geothermarchaeota archaeon]HEW94344.1 YbaK/EbsC family protein [Thermoprotei archaeon]
MEMYLDIIKRLEEAGVSYILFYNRDGFETVEKASKYTGYPPENILKTMILKAGEKLIAYIVRGDQRVNLNFISSYLGLKVKLADVKSIKNELGIEVGGLSVLHPNIMRIDRYMSRKCLEVSDVIVGGGDRLHLFKVSIKDLIELTKPTILDDE